MVTAGGVTELIVITGEVFKIVDSASVEKFKLLDNGKFTSTQTITPGETGGSVQTTGSGNSAGVSSALKVSLLPGYIGSTANFGLYAQNKSAGVSVNELTNPQAANYGEYIATTTGYIAGQAGYAAGGNRSYGGLFLSIIAKTSATNIGAAGYATNPNAGGTQIGGYFGLLTSGQTFTSAALLIDNGSTTSPIFVAKDNGSTVFSIADGGNVSINGNLRATSGIFSNMTATTSVTTPLISGSASSGQDLTMESTSNATKGKVCLDGSIKINCFDEANSFWNFIKSLATTAVNYVVKIGNYAYTKGKQATLAFTSKTPAGTEVVGASIGAVFSHSSTARSAALVFSNMTGGAIREAMRITGDKIGVGTTTPTTQFYVATELTGGTSRGITIAQHSDSTAGAVMGFVKSRGTQAAPAKVAHNDFVATFGGLPYTGTEYVTNAASVAFKVLSSASAGGVKANNVPTGIVFRTGNGSSPASPVTADRMTILPTGQVGIGTTTPTSQFQVGTRFQAYSSGRLVFGNYSRPAGVGLTEGEIRKNKHTFYGTQYLVERSFQMNHEVMTSDVTVGNTAAETTVYTAAQAANYPTVGKTVVVNLYGRFSKTAAVANFTVRVKVGSSTALTITKDVAAGSPLTDVPFHGRFAVTYRTVGASGTTISSGSMDINDVSYDISSTGTMATDTTAVNNITVTVQWGTANASNTVTFYQGWTDTIGFLENDLRNSLFAGLQTIGRRDYVETLWKREDYA